MKVVVTGAAGFIGGHLVERLKAAGHAVDGCDKAWGTSTADPWWADGRRVDDADVVVHLGANCSTANSYRDVYGDFVDNVVGTLQVCEASARAGGVPIVFTSTCKARAGFDWGIAPLGQSKRVAEKYLQRYRDWHGVPYAILRPSTVYGPQQRGTAAAGWVTWFAKAALTGQRIVIAGDGTQSRDILYIDDFVGLLADMVERFDAYAPDGRLAPTDVGGGPANEVSLLDLLDELDYHNVIHVDRLAGDLQRVVSDNERISRPGGWQPTVGWREGLALTREWLKGQS